MYFSLKEPHIRSAGCSGFSRQEQQHATCGLYLAKSVAHSGRIGLFIGIERHAGELVGVFEGLIPPD